MVPYFAFGRLGPEAFTCAEPGLMQIYEENISPSSRLGTLSVLLSFTPHRKEFEQKLLPQFLEMATNREHSLRRFAVCQLATMESAAALVVPALTESLRDSDADIRQITAFSLQYYGTNALAAVPALIQLLKDPSSDVRSCAAISLRSIAPEAAAKAGVN